MAAAKCPASAALQRKLVQALGTCTACAPQIEYFEQLAGTCPEIDTQVAELRVMLDLLQKMTQVGLNGTIDPGASEQDERK